VTADLYKVVVTTHADALVPEARILAEQLGLPFEQAAVTAELALNLTPAHLELVELGAGAPGPVYVDFIEGAMGHRRKHGGGRGQLVARAVGIKKDRTPTVIDATAGLGRDAFILAQLGCQVRMLERSPLVAALLQDGMLRGETDAEVAEIITRMTLTVTDAREFLLGLDDALKPDVVYVDPMHPERNKAAAVKKEMRLFRELVGGDADDAELLSAALKAARRRVVVKRPRKAEAIPGPKPDLVYEGKSTRFDVYLISS